MHIEPQDNVSSFKSLFESGESSEALQKNIADFFPAIIVLYDPSQKRIQFYNKKLIDILGYTDEEIENLDHNFLNFVFEDDISLIQKELNQFQYLKDNETYSFNCRLNHKQGSWRYFRTQVNVMKRNENGVPVSLLFIAYDITQEVQTEEESKAATDLLTEAEELLHFGTWTWDIINNKEKWSRGLYTLLGYSDIEIPVPLGDGSFINHVNKNDAAALEEAIKHAIKNKIDFRKTFKVITKDKKERIVSTHGKVITSPLGNVIKIIVVTRDITEQILFNKEQQKLKDSLARYKESMIEKERLLDFGSFEMDLVNNELFWSDGMYILFDYDPVTEKGKITIDESFYKSHMTEAEFFAAKNKFQEALKNQQNYTIETSVGTKNGTTKRLETYGKIERDTSGEPYKIIGITRDITRLKEYEINLQQKIEELDRSNKELEEFAYIASHDLQEPLRKITAFSERLQEKLEDKIGEEGLLYLHRILAATQNMRILIDNLLEFSRTSRHNQLFEKIDLNLILKQVMTDLELKIEETNCEIECYSMPEIVAIQSQMIQLFTNILSNAIKFRKPGKSPEIKIACSKLTENEKKEHHFPTNKEFYKISVRDYGIGFEQEYSLKIFQIFQRLHGKAEYPGSGIGLAICKKIVENHNGIIYAESKPGIGSTFSFILPENQN
jgi:PAS domain S-box-containing protein